jgi:hypothetical protein
MISQLATQPNLYEHITIKSLKNFVLILVQNDMFFPFKITFF